MVRPVHAAEDLSTIYPPGAALGGSGATISKLLSPLIQNAIIFTALASFIAIIIAGFNLISSQGDKTKVQQSTTMLNYALVGLTLAVGAFVITQIVGRIGGFEFLNPGI